MGEESDPDLPLRAATLSSILQLLLQQPQVLLPDRLAKLTGQPLFGELRDRMIQSGFWAQPASGDWIGGINERMCDPWKALSSDFDSTAQVYTGELATDAALQLLELGLAKPGNKPLDPNHDAPRGK